MVLLFLYHRTNLRIKSKNVVGENTQQRRENRKVLLVKNTQQWRKIEDAAGEKKRNNGKKINRFKSVGKQQEEHFKVTQKL